MIISLVEFALEVTMEELGVRRRSQKPNPSTTSAPSIDKSTGDKEVEMPDLGDAESSDDTKIQEIKKAEDDEKAEQVRVLNAIAGSTSVSKDDEQASQNQPEMATIIDEDSDAIFASVDNCYSKFDIKTNTFNDVYKSVEKDTQITMDKAKRKAVRRRLRELILSSE
jgi:hypothetical protein